MSPLLSAVALGVLFAGVATSAASNDVLKMSGQAIYQPLTYSSHAPLTRQSMIPCSCADSICSCCTQVNIPLVANKPACLNTKFDSSNLAVSVNFKFGETVIFEQVLSASNPPPFCFPVPMLPILMACLRIHNIKLIDNGVYACIKVELQLMGTPLIVLNFDCVKVTTGGISPVKPQSASNVSVQLSNPAATHEANVEVYDTVNETKNALDNSTRNNITMTHVTVFYNSTTQSREIIDKLINILKAGAFNTSIKDVDEKEIPPEVELINLSNTTTIFEKLGESKMVP